LKEKSLKDKRYDYILLIVTLLLVGTGIIALFSASVPYAHVRYGDGYFFVKHQLKWLAMGIFFLWLASKFNYQKYKNLSLPLLFFTLILLVCVFIPGIGEKMGGASRWISLGNISFQPSDIAKITLVVYLSFSLVRKKERVESFVNGFLPYFIIIGSVFFLITIEPDLSSALIVAIVSFILLYAGRAKISHLIYALFLISVPLYFSISEVGYRKSRILGFLYPEKEPYGISFQLRHLKISLGSGGLWGVGPGKGKEKLFYLPTPHTDSIFAVIGEEWGFIGTTFITALFFILAWRGFSIARKVPDGEGKLLSVGLTSLICVQAIINMGVATAILPTTGVPLPFISYGGSSLIVSLTAVGILLNISRRIYENAGSGDKNKDKIKRD